MASDAATKEPQFLSLNIGDSDDQEGQEITSFFRTQHHDRQHGSRRRTRSLGSRKWSRRPTSRSIIWAIRASASFISGFLFASIILPFSHWPVKDHFDDAFRRFDTSSSISPYSPDYPTEYMKSVLPIPCHSHNDYWRRRPLYSALGSGCISIEADVWNIGQDLFVAHSMDEVEADRTLESLYIKPLVEILDQLNLHTAPGSPARGVFYQNPTQTLILVVDLKDPETWQLLQDQIEPLRKRGYLTFWNGVDRIERSITVVASGTTPFDLVVANETYRDIFFDAPLQALVECSNADCTMDDAAANSLSMRYNASNSYYASSSLVHALGPLAGFALTESQMTLMQQQVRDARSRGLIPRYYGTPRWPRGLRDEIWSVLLHQDVGVLNVDDLRAVRKGTWGSWPQNHQRNIV